MKTRIVLSVLLVLSVAVFFFSKSRAIENEKQVTSVNTSNGPNDFLIGAIQSGPYKDFSGMGKLSFNLWHRYIGYAYRNGYAHPWGWTGNDSLEAAPGTYVQGVQDILDSNASFGLYSLMLRPKIMYLCYGQRSDYQCESMSTSQTEWFHSYLTHQTGREIPDSGATVMFCCVDSAGHPAGYVVKDLIANREQCNNTWGAPFNDNTYDWYVEPRIRIPTGVGNNTPVCKIEILNWDSVVVKTFELTGASFKNENLIYNGQYLDEFSRIPGQAYEPLKISLSDSIKFNPKGYEWTRQELSCGFDIRVYWYKQCNMWIDYVRMENNVAYDLINIKSSNHAQDSLWIQWEGQYIGNYTQGKPFKFYVDETEYNHLPCIEYVNKKIQQICPNVSVASIPFTAFNLLTRHWSGTGIEWVPFSYQDKKAKLESMGVKEILIDLYPLAGDHYSMSQYGMHAYIPNTLCPNCVYDVSKGQLGVTTTVNNYDNSLQSLLDTKGFTDNLKMCDSLSKDLNIPIYFIEQAHLYLSYQNQTGNVYSQREPSNEELEVMADIAISYGSKSVIYYSYDSWGDFYPIVTDTGNYYQYSKGLMENNFSNPPAQNDTIKRDSNAYGQKKWEKFVELDKKLKKWGPALMSFNNTSTHSYVYRQLSERALLNSNSCFIYFSTLKPGSGTPDCGNQDFTPDNIPSGYTYDCSDSTYLQIATFENTEPNAKYFMVVNRRCSPFKDSNTEENRGGRRKVRAYLHTDYSAFSAFKNWSIVNCENDSTVAVFNKSNPGYVNLDYFMPGEGRLYKIVPTIETGGTLVCNENFNCDVTCRKNIYNNGFNITIGTSANISFADSVGIYMTGGNLTIGNENEDAVPNYLQFKGIAGSNKWQGFVLDECGIVQVYGVYFYNILPNQSAINIINCYHYKVENNHFVCAKGENSNGVNVIYNTTLDDGPNTYHYIRNNTFSFNESSNPAVQVISNAGTTIPVLIESNHFSIGAGNYSSLGIILTGVSGGVIRQNDITEYVNGIFFLSL